MKPEYKSKSLGFRIGFLSRQSRKYFEYHADKLGLHGGQMIILKNLAQQDGLSQNDLSRKLQVDKAHIARTIKKLEEKKIVSRQVCKNDSRLNKLYLTESGKILIPTIKEIYSNWTQKLGTDFTETEKEQMNNLLIRMCRNVENIKEELI